MSQKPESGNNNSLYFVIGGLVALVVTIAFFSFGGGQYFGHDHRGDHDAAIARERLENRRN